MRPVELVVWTVLLAAAVPAPAIAQRCQAPPGTAAVEQYCETLPEVTGNRATTEGGIAGVAESRPAGVAPETLRKLEGTSEQGQALGAYLRSTGAVESRRSRSAPAPPGRSRAERPSPHFAPPNPGMNPLRAISAASGGGETVSRGYPWLLLLIAVAVGGAAWLRQERREHG